MSFEAIIEAGEAFRHLDDEVIRNQRPALRNDRRPVVHLALHRAGHLDGLQLRLERARKGTLDHPFEPVLKALQDSHRCALLPCRIRSYRRYGAAWGRANLTAAQGRVAERQTRTVQVRVSERT